MFRLWQVSVIGRGKFSVMRKLFLQSSLNYCIVTCVLAMPYLMTKLEIFYILKVSFCIYLAEFSLRTIFLEMKFYLVTLVHYITLDVLSAI